MKLNWVQIDNGDQFVALDHNMILTAEAGDPPECHACVTAVARNLHFTLKLKLVEIHVPTPVHEDWTFQEVLDKVPL